MNDIEIKAEIVRAIKNRAYVAEMQNMQRPQDKRIPDTEMINRFVKIVKEELKAEKEKLL